MGSSYVPPNLKGRMFKNENKRSGRSPDYTGLLNIDGRVYRIIGWYNPPDEKSSVPTISLIAENKVDYDERQQNRLHSKGRPAPEQPAQGDFDDDIPF